MINNYDQLIFNLMNLKIIILQELTLINSLVFIKYLKE
jgi:hypothetical protein